LSRARDGRRRGGGKRADATDVGRETREKDLPFVDCSQQPLTIRPLYSIVFADAAAVEPSLSVARKLFIFHRQQHINHFTTIETRANSKQPFVDDDQLRNESSGNNFKMR
jgi:hypothetical protein